MVLTNSCLNWSFLIVNWRRSAEAGPGCILGSGQTHTAEGFSSKQAVLTTRIAGTIGHYAFRRQPEGQNRWRTAGLSRTLINLLLFGALGYAMKAGRGQDTLRFF